MLCEFPKYECQQQKRDTRATKEVVVVSPYDIIKSTTLSFKRSVPHVVGDLRFFPPYHHTHIHRVMGLTEFDGYFVIHPTLPPELAEAVNSLCAFRNNAYGDGDLNSFDSVVHHLHGRPSERTWAMYKSKKDGTSKTPSVWCHWKLSNQRVSPRSHAQRTILEWDREERFNDYMYWAQYVVDFITLLAEKQYGIKISGFTGKMTWEGM